MRCYFNNGYLAILLNGVLATFGNNLFLNAWLAKARSAVLSSWQSSMAPSSVTDLTKEHQVVMVEEAKLFPTRFRSAHWPTPKTPLQHLPPTLRTRLHLILHLLNLHHPNRHHLRANPPPHPQHPNPINRHPHLQATKSKATRTKSTAPPTPSKATPTSSPVTPTLSRATPTQSWATVPPSKATTTSEQGHQTLWKVTPIAGQGKEMS